MKRATRLAFLFLLGFSAGLLVWPRIVLPFSNPWDIVGGLPAVRFNPANNTVRFLVLVAAPLLAVGFACRLSGTARQWLLSRPSAAPLSATASPRAPRGLCTVAVVALALAVGLNRSARLFETDAFHEGESLGAAVTWQAGGRPYRDILFVHGVYQDPLRAVVAFKLFGRSIGAARTLESVDKLAAYALFALVVVRYGGGGAVAWAVMSVLASLFATRWLALQPRDVTVVAFLLSFAALHRRLSQGASRPGMIPSFLWAFLVPAAFAYSVDRGFYLAGTFCLLAPLCYLRVLNRAGLAAPLIWPPLAGLATGVVLLGVALRGEFWAFFDFVFLKLPWYKELLDGYVFDVFQAPYLAAGFLAALNVYWLTIRVAATWATSSPARWAAVFDRWGLEVCLMVLSLLCFRSVLARADVAHLATDTWPTVLLTLVLLSRSTVWQLVPPAAVRVAVGTAGVVGVLILGAALWRAWEQRLLQRNFPWRVPDAVLIPEDYRTTAARLRRLMDSDDKFYTLTNEGIWYYLLGRPAPSRFYLAFLAAPRFYQEELVRDLERSRVKYVLVADRSQASRLDGLTNFERLPRVAAYLRRHYRPLITVRHHELWVRTDPLLSGAARPDAGIP